MKTLVAANASPMTLDGTRTYLIGRERVAVIDPGPQLDEHMNAVVDAVGGGVVIAVLLTHSHPDHADAAEELAARFSAPLQSAAAGTLIHNAAITTDEGLLRALATPGHTPDHFSFWWQPERAVFCGDLMMGGMDTALVARPEGDLVQYLESLRTISYLRPLTIYPGHGEPFADPRAAIDGYIAHREGRIAQVVEGLKDGPLSAQVLLGRVYGDGLEDEMRDYAGAALDAYLAYLREHQLVRESATGTWSLT